MLGIHMAMLQSVLERMSADLNLSLTAAGSLVTFNFVGVLLGPLLAGELGDRIGRKPVALAAMAGYMAAAVLAAFAGNYGILAASILLMGTAYSILESSITGLVSDGNPGFDGMVLNFSQAFFSVGAVIGPLLTLWVLGTPLGWRGMMGVMTALFGALLLLFAGLPVPAGQAVSRPHPPGKASLNLVRNSFFLLLCLGMFLYVGVEGAAAYWMDTYFITILTQPQLGKVALALFWGGTLAGRLLGGRFDRYANAWLTGGLALSVVSFTAAVFIHDPWVNVALFALAGLGFSTVWPNLVAKAVTRYPQSRGAAIGLMMATSGVGGMVIPLIMGSIGDSHGMAAALWTLPLISAALLALCLIVIFREKQPVSIQK